PEERGVGGAQAVEDGEQRAHAEEIEEAAHGIEDRPRRLSRAQVPERLLEAQPHVVVPGGVAEQRWLRVVAEEMELQAEAEGHEGRHRGRGGGNTRGRRRGAPLVTALDSGQSVSGPSSWP